MSEDNEKNGSETTEPANESAVSSANEPAEQADAITDGAADVKSGETSVNTKDSEVRHEDKPDVKTGTKTGTKKANVAVIAILSAVALVVIIVGFIMLNKWNNRKTEIDLDDYITVTYTGYDHLGQATIEFNEEQFEQDYGKKIRYTSEGRRAHKKDDAVELFESIVEDQLPLEAYATGLSNGDTFDFEWEDFSVNKLQRNFKVLVSFDKVTVTVSDLETAPSVDLFEGIDVTFDGIGPNGNATIVNNSEYSDIYYSIDKSSGLSNGDVVTVTASPYDSDDLDTYCLQSMNKLPEADTKEFTVDGLAAYCTAYEQIPADTLQSMLDQSASVASAELASQVSDGVTAVGSTYVGYYFQTAKNTADDYYYDANRLILVYKNTIHVTLSDGDGNSFDQDVSYYNYTMFNAIMVMPDGTGSVSMSEYDTPSSYTYTLDTGVSEGWFSTYTLYLAGYDSIDSLKNELVAQVVDSYDYTESITDGEAAPAETTADPAAAETTSSETSAADPAATETTAAETTAAA